MAATAVAPGSSLLCAVLKILYLCLCVWNVIVGPVSVRTVLCAFGIGIWHALILELELEFV